MAFIRERERERERGGVAGERPVVALDNTSKQNKEENEQERN